VAAKFHPRVFEDRRVVQAPSQEDLARLRETYPDVEFLPEAQEGQRLREMPNQDPYSYRLARVYIAADSQEELLDKFQRVMDEAGYEFEE